MFLEQTCDPIQSKECWRNVARGSGDGNLLFKGEQLQSLVSGRAFCVDARAGTPVGIYLFAVLKRKLTHGDGLS